MSGFKFLKPFVLTGIFAVLAVLMPVFICGFLCPSNAMASDAVAFSYTSTGGQCAYSAVDEAIKDGYSGKTIYMDCDWNLLDTIKIEDSKTLTIDMNGYRITSNSGNTGIRLCEHSKLTLKSSNTVPFKYTGYSNTDGSQVDTQLSSGGLITGVKTNDRAGAFRMDDYSTLTLDNVAVAGNSGGYAGGIYVNGNCNVCMKNAASIQSNKGKAGGIDIIRGENSSLYMDNSSICSNFATDLGGAVACEGNNVKIQIENNSSISDNTARSGGAFCFSSSYYSLVSQDKTGLIANNKSIREYDDPYRGGGAIMSIAHGKIDGLTIRGNSTVGTGGGICIRSNHISVTNCTITGNTAAQSGGGAFVEEWEICSDKDTSFNDCVISNNVCNTVLDHCGGGGIYVREGSNVKLTGKMVVDKNIQVTSQPSDKFPTYDKNSIADNVFLDEDFFSNSYIVGGVDEGSKVGIRTTFDDERRIGKSITKFVEGTYFMDSVFCHLSYGSDCGGDLWQRKGAQT